MKFGRIVLQAKRTEEVFFDMTSYFQDGGRYVISCNKVLTSGE